MKLHKENKLGKVVNPDGVPQSCDENKFWHYGAYDAYCKIKGKTKQTKGR